MRVARIWHGGTAAIAAFALVIQAILSVVGAAVLVEGEPPDLAQRMIRLVSYFTIQSNLLVLITTVGLFRRPDRDGRWWRVLRLDAIVGITVTGLVHFFLLRPLLDLTGWSYATDLLLHVVVPVMAVAGWILFGPRPRVDRATFGLAWIWPVLWTVVTMLVGAATAWYPYPFLNPDLHGTSTVVISMLGILVLFAAIFGVVWLVDRRAPAR